MRLRRSDFALWDVAKRRTWRRLRRQAAQEDVVWVWMLKRAKETRGVYAIVCRTPVLTLLCGVALLCHEAQAAQGHTARLTLRRVKRIVKRCWPDLDGVIERAPPRWIAWRERRGRT